MRGVLIMIAVLFAASLSFSQSQPPPPDSRDSIENHNISNVTQKKPAKAYQLGTETTPFVVKVQTPVAPKTNEGAEKQENHLSSEWWLVYLTAALVAVTFGLVIFTANLWRTTKDLAQDATNTATKQAADMQASLQIAKDAADAAKDQAQTATESLQRTKRAWIGVLWPVEMVAPLSFENDEVRCNIRLTIKNVGASPAVGTCLTCKLVVAPHPYPDPRNYVTVADEGFMRMATDGFGIPVIPGDPMQWSTIEVKEPINQTITGGQSDVSVWLTGYIAYKDEFGFLHSSSFLFSFVTHEGEQRIAPNRIVEGRFEPYGAGWIST